MSGKLGKLFAVLLLAVMLCNALPSYAAAPNPPSKETVERQLAVQTALGKVKPTLVLRGATVLNVFTGRWMPYQDIVIAGRRIAFVGPVGTYSGEVDKKTIVNLTGYTVVPSFGESHNHIESIHLTPDGAAQILLPLGTTWNAEAGHELGNALSPEQNRLFWYMAEQAGSPFTVLWQPGSAVPPTPYEHTAAVNDYATMMTLYAKDLNTIGLDEVMDGPSWQNPKNVGYDRLWGALSATWDSGRIVSGHLSRMYDYTNINAGAAAGLQNDHTLTIGDEALRKMEAGISLLLTPGNLAKNVSYLHDQARITDWSHVAVTTDDKAVDDILDSGTINANVKQVMALGVDPADAYRMGSFYPAQMWHLEKDFGSVAPGRYADLIVLRDIKNVDIYQVYAKGELWAQDGKLVKTIPPVKWPEWATTGSMHVRKLTTADFEIKSTETTVEAATLQPFWYAPDYYTTTLKTSGGIVQPDAAQKISQFCVVDRYNNLPQPVACMFWQNVGPKTPRTAWGSTVAHDHHNIQVVGNDQAAMALAANRLAEMGGGFVLVQDGKVTAEVVLEIGGLMSARPPEVVAKNFRDYWKTVDTLEWFAPGKDSDPNYDAVALNAMKRQIFATLTCTPWVWVLVAPFKDCPSGFVNVTTGECRPVVK